MNLLRMLLEITTCKCKGRYSRSKKPHIIHYYIKKYDKRYLRELVRLKTMHDKVIVSKSL